MEDTRQRNVLSARFRVICELRYSFGSELTTVNQRLAEALGVIALGIMSTGLFVPQATAQSAPNLAPGVGCEGFRCFNNTDDTYRIEWDAICVNPGTYEPRTVVPTRNWVFPHQEIFMDMTCPYDRLVGSRSRHHHDHDHDRHHDHDHHRRRSDDLVQGYMVDAHYKAALIDNPAPPPVPTGSAG